MEVVARDALPAVPEVVEQGNCPGVFMSETSYRVPPEESSSEDESVGWSQTSTPDNDSSCSIFIFLVAGLCESDSQSAPCNRRERSLEMVTMALRIFSALL